MIFRNQMAINMVYIYHQCSIYASAFKLQRCQEKLLVMAFSTKNPKYSVKMKMFTK